MITKSKSFKGCDLCQMKPIKTGREKLLFEDKFCWIAENRTLEIRIQSFTFHCKRRLAFVLKEHKKVLNPGQELKMKKIIIRFMLTALKLKEGPDYFIRTTMNTYPDHYHTTAIIYPLTGRAAKSRV